LVVVGAPAACTSGPRAETQARNEVRTFLAAAAKDDPDAACATFTPALLSRLAPTDGGCLNAIATLSRYTTDGGDDLLDDKKIDKVTVDGKVAVVTVVDRSTGDHALAIRVVDQDGDWRIDEIGAGAQLTEACSTERKALAAAIERYFEDHDRYPTDAAQMVPGLLPKVPDNHKVGKQGAVVATGVCA
jgi:hypothetical protein